MKPARSDPIRRIVPHTDACPDRNCSFFEAGGLQAPGIQTDIRYEEDLQSPAKPQSPAMSHGSKPQSPLVTQQYQPQSPAMSHGSKPQSPALTHGSPASSLGNSKRPSQNISPALVPEESIQV